MGTVQHNSVGIELTQAEFEDAATHVIAGTFSPTAHKNEHKNSGGDAFAVTDLLNAIARVSVRKNTGADIGSRRRLNLIEGFNITLTVADDAVGEEVDITITAAGGGILVIPVADHSYSAVAAVSGTAGENLALGEVCYKKSDGMWWKTKGDSYNTTEGLLGMATAAIAAAASGVILLQGYFRDNTWAWAGGPLWLSEVTAGALTETKPSGGGQQIRRAGYVETADIVAFFPDGTILEVA